MLNDHVKFNPILKRDKFVKCRVSIKKEFGYFLRASQKIMVTDLETNDKINFRIVAINYNSRSHLTKKKRSITGKCILQFIK